MGLKEFIAMSFVIYCALFIALCLSGLSDYKSINGKGEFLIQLESLENNLKGGWKQMNTSFKSADIVSVLSTLPAIIILIVFYNIGYYNITSCSH